MRRALIVVIALLSLAFIGASVPMTRTHDQPNAPLPPPNSGAHFIQDLNEVPHAHAVLVARRWSAIKVWVDALERDRWFAGIAHIIDVEQQRQQERTRRHRLAFQSTNSSHSSSSLVAGHTPCAIPAYICVRESGYNITAQNPVSSASGKYQILDSTWQGYGGYARAADAPEAVQDAKARSMALCNWMPPNYCA
jgi:hypothetical protein